MKNLRHLFRRSGLLSTEKRRRRSENPRRSDATQRRLTNEVLEKRELLAGDILASDMHNYWNRYDVNDDGQISARDALGVINYMNSSGEGEAANRDVGKMFYDVNADSNITAADALGVINAMNRGEEVGELVELLLTARDLNDQPIVADGNGEINVDVGQRFDLEVSYDDLRLFNERLGVFQLFTDITVSQSGVLSPVLNETQRLIIDSTLTSVPSTSLTFAIPQAPPGVSGGSLTYESSINDFGNNASGEVVNALNAFGYSSSQFEVNSLDFGNNDIGFQVHWVGDQFGNVNLPNISVEVNETNPADDIPTQTVEFAPFLADGVTPNTDAVRFNINAFSRTFNNNEEFYSAQNRGDFDPATGFAGVGGLGMVPLEGGGIPQLTDDGGFIEPFDAFSLRVFLNQAVTDLVIGVNPGEDPEATLLYGRDDAVPQDMVLIENVDTNGNGIASITVNAGAVVSQPGTLAISPATLSVTEGDAGTTTATFTVTRTSGSDGIVSVNFATADGTAMAGSDYTANSGTVTFADGDTAAKTITVSVIGDTLDENDETFTVTLSSPTGDATLGTAVSTVTIIDDDVTVAPGVLSISPATLSVTEGDAGTTTATFTVSRASGSDGAVSVNFATADGTATAGSDYTANSGTVTFADGDTAAKTITVLVTGDTIEEGNETFTVTLSSPTGGATLGTAVSTVTIIDDDGTTPVPGVLSISPATLSVTEGNSGTTTATFTVSRASGSDGAVSVSFATADGTATAGSDYTANSGTVNFADGDTAAKTITVLVIGDTIDEGNETFTVTLSSPTGGATLGTAVSTVTIIDDDVTVAPGVLSISPATLSVTEGDVGTTTATFTVSRASGSDGMVSVNFATADGTATAGSDYTANSGTVTFADGDTAAKTITVSVIGDTIDEGNETFTVTLSSPTGGATLGTAVSTVTIIDDDFPVSVPGVLSISPATLSVTEGNSGTTTATFTVSRASGSDGIVSVNFATADGTATAGSDYTANSGTLTFADGDTTAKTITVSVIGDTFDEPDETFTVTLSSPTGGATLGTAVSTATIIDDDLPGNVPGSSIGGAIFIDHVENLSDIILSNADPIRNGIKDSDESGLGGVPIRLVSAASQNSTGQAINLTAFTELDGSYSFEGVAPGNYSVVYDVDHSTVIFLGVSEIAVTIGSAGGETQDGLNFALIGTQGSALDTVDILATSYLRTNPPMSQLSGGGREGGIVSLDANGNQNFFIADEGFEGIRFAELVLNDARDAALLTVIEDDGDVLTARLSREHFVVTTDGRGVQFFGGIEDFVFNNADTLSVEDEFTNFRNAIDQVLAGM